jgi:uncharacterized protein HemX
VKKENMDALATGVAGAAGVFSVMWMWIQKQRANFARTASEVANDKRDKEVADAQGTVYQLLTNQVTVMQAQITQLRKDLDAEREESRVYQEKFAKLVSWVKEQGQVPPDF